jgi:hypothetical protein
MQTNVMHENNAAVPPLPEGQIDNDDEYEDEDHDKLAKFFLFSLLASAGFFH